jgi:hypothetical protein
MAVFSLFCRERVDQLSLGPKCPKPKRKVSTGNLISPQNNFRFGGLVHYSLDVLSTTISRPGSHCLGHGFTTCTLLCFKAGVTRKLPICNQSAKAFHIVLVVSLFKNLQHKSKKVPHLFFENQNDSIENGWFRC